MSQSQLHRYQLPLTIFSWLVFAIAFIIYLITTDPSVSYWDCPEYVLTASKMEIGHPPGNPIWMLAMRVATIPFPAHLHAYVINIWSGVFMAFAAFFLCRIIFPAIRIYLDKSNNFRNLTKKTADFSASVIAIGGALCFAFCDSVWFSAVEAEVYALSVFLGTLSLWILVRWWFEKSSVKRCRWLILLAYITGLSLGVHQLNLLLIPVYALVIFYRLHPKKSNPFFCVLIIGLSVLLVGVLLMGLVPGLLYLCGLCELFCVNSLDLPYNSGVITFSLILLIIIVGVLTAIQVRKKLNKNVFIAVWSFSFFILGSSSFAIILIRSIAAPPVNETSPNNIFALTSYIQREAYPSVPLIYGRTPYSKSLTEEKFSDGQPYYSHYVFKKGKPLYHPVMEGNRLKHRSGFLTHADSLTNKHISERGRGYLLKDYSFSHQLTPELDMWFPRLTSGKTSDIDFYEDWADMKKENMVMIPVSETIDSLGNPQPKLSSIGGRKTAYSYRPTYTQNLKYLVAYQTYYMYLRYLFWNFIGRQNDFPATGEIEHGNFITGISPIDSRFLGVTDEIPPEIGQDNKGRNIYYAIPFLFGIIGIFFLALCGRRERRILSVIALLFIMTGFAIVAYLNQTPGEPRERDYTFLLSYLAFTLWIAAGFMAVFYLLLNKILNSGKSKNSGIKRYACFSILTIISLGTPTLMAVVNFDDHDRRGRFEPTFYASSFLDFEIPAIIFSHGDNSTFPLWYASEVLEMGPSHVPVDVTYLTQADYAVNLKKQGNKGLKLMGNSSQLAYGAFLFSKIPDDAISRPIPLQEALRQLYASETDTPEFPSSKIILPSFKGDSVVLNLHDFSSGNSYLSFKHLMLLDMIASELDSPNPRALFFPHLIDYSFQNALQPVLQNALFGKIYAPWLTDSLNNDLLRKSVERELHKISELQPDFSNHYADPLLADRSRRYRGELIIAANQLLQTGDTSSAIAIADTLTKYYPYETLLPGDFTLEKQTFYEGEAFCQLLKDLSLATGNQRFNKDATKLDSLMQARHEKWIKYYRSLPPSQRSTLSNRSLRQIISRKK